MSPDERAQKRIRKIRHKLGFDLDPEGDYCPRMKHRHQDTHENLLDDLQFHEERYLWAFMKGTRW